MKILHAISGQPFGEAERAFEYTVTSLVDFDVEQHLVIGSNRDRAERLKSIGLEPTEIAFNASLDFSSRRRLYREVENFTPDLIISWTSDVAFYLWQTNFKHIGYVDEGFAIFKYESCKHLFSLSPQRTEPAINAGWPRERISVLPPVIPSKTVKPIDRQVCFTPKTAKVVILVGPLESDQGADILMQAVARIPGLYFWVLGDGQYIRDLQAMATTYGIKPRSRFIPWREDSAAIVAAEDIVICPSKQDNVGIQVLEGWAQKKPVIAADSIGPGLLISNEDNGILVPVNNIRSLSEAIKWLKDDANFSKKIALGGYKKFNEIYSSEVTIPQYLNLFEQVITETD